MTISVECQGCGRSYRLSDEAAGRTVRCRDCSQPIRVPARRRPPSQPAPDDEFAWDNDEISDEGPALPPPPAVRRSRTRPKSPKKANRKAALGVVWAVCGIVGFLVAGTTAFFVVRGAIVAAQSRVGSVSSAEWTEFSPPNGRYRVLMPTTPRLDLQRSGPLLLHTYMSRSWQSAYVVTHADNVPIIDVASQLDGARDGALANAPGSRLLSERPITLNGIHPGRELLIAVGQTQVCMRIWFVETSLYMLAVEQRGTLSRNDADRFFDSFQLAGGPP